MNTRPPVVTDEVVERDETGWLIEQRPHPEHIVYAALCFEPIERDSWCTIRHGDAPIIFVKDASHALRFARKRDAEAFVKVFDRFLLNPIVTEHEWPLASMPAVVSGGHGER